MKGPLNSTSVLLALLFVGFICCEFPQGRQGKMETYDQWRSEKIEVRDSLFVLHAIKGWSKLNWFTFEDFSQMYKMTNEQVHYFIASVFYSPDKKKMLVWYGDKTPNSPTLEIYNDDDPEVNRLCPDGPDTVYSMSALIGIRNNINAPWSLYPFNKKQATCYDTKEKVINVLGQYYFEQMKTHSWYVRKTYLDENYGGEVRHDLEKKRFRGGGGSMILKNFGYNLQDKGFWEKSLIWQKGSAVEGYYLFQLRGTEPIETPEIDYPKEILDMYD